MLSRGTVEFLPLTYLGFCFSVVREDEGWLVRMKKVAWK